MPRLSLPRACFCSNVDAALRWRRIFDGAPSVGGRAAACTVPVSVVCTLLLQYWRLFSIYFATVSSPLRFSDVNGAEVFSSEGKKSGYLGLLFGAVRCLRENFTIFAGKCNDF